VWKNSGTTVHANERWVAGMSAKQDISLQLPQNQNKEEENNSKDYRSASGVGNATYEPSNYNPTGGVFWSERIRV
jgi:hypothetical protein